MPYELTEYGWGEFDAIIRVHFRDPSEKPIEFYHPVKLFAAGGETIARPIVYEFYDEIVFQDPPEKLLRLLRSTPHGSGVKLKQSSLAGHCTYYSSQRILQSYLTTLFRIVADSNLMFSWYLLA